MADESTFHAGKPAFTTHPVIGGDALRFPIEPSPPGLWWIALRKYATADDLLVRPWDEPKQSSLTVECPDAAALDAVIDAVNRVIERANDDYARALSAGVEAKERFDVETERRRDEREAIVRAIDARYPDDSASPSLAR